MTTTLVPVSLALSIEVDPIAAIRDDFARSKPKSSPATAAAQIRTQDRCLLVRHPGVAGWRPVEVDQLEQIYDVRALDECAER